MYEAWFDASTNKLKYQTVIGGVISFNGNVIKQYSRNIDYRKSSLMAEYIALVELLQVLSDMFVRDVKIYGDCQNVVFSVNGISRNKSKRKVSMYLTATELMKKFEQCQIIWVPRKENRIADKLCRDFICT